MMGPNAGMSRFRGVIAAPGLSPRLMLATVSETVVTISSAFARLQTAPIYYLTAHAIHARHVGMANRLCLLVTSENREKLRAVMAHYGLRTMAAAVWFAVTELYRRAKS